jgi:diguanylate cyclase (GGDEF)-like protein
MRSSRSFLAACFVLLMATAPMAIGTPARVDDLLEQHRHHGYPSPQVAMRRLMAASDRPADDAPVAQRQRYYAELGIYAITAGDKHVAEQAQTRLERLATREGCKPCHVQWQVRQSRIAVADREFEQARGHLRQARDAMPETTPELRLDIEAAQAHLHEQAREPGEAIEAGLKAAELAARLERPAEQVGLLGIVMQANLSRGDLDRGLELSHEIYALAERIGYTYEMALTRTNQGYVHGARHDYPKFHATLKDALRLSQSVPGMEDFVLTTLINLSAYHIYVGEYPQSIEVTQRAETLAQQSGNELSRAFVISNRGSAMARMGQVEAGLALMQQASDLADRAGDKRASIDLLNEKVNIYELVGRSDDGLKTLRRVIALTAELTQGERESAVQELQAKFSAERKTREIERLSAENARRRAEVDARTWQQRLWAAVAVALGLGAVLLVQLLKRVRHANRRLAVDNAALVEESSHDALTGAFNRRHGQRLLARHEALLRAGTGHGGVGLIVLDVDHFKKINDTHGHKAGDAVLVELVKRLQALVRQHDAVVRWGGEEFVLVLPDTSAQGLAVLADRVLRAIGDEPVTADGKTIAVTVSLGALAFPFHPEQHWEDALNVADLALYRSKANGRNRATCLMQVAADAQPDRVRRDLAAAQAAGEIVLQTVVGAVRQHACRPRSSCPPERSKGAAVVDDGREADPALRSG